MKEITKILYENSLYFRGFEIKYSSENINYEKEFKIYEIYDEDINIKLDDIIIQLISIIDNNVTFLINDVVYELTMENKILHINNDNYSLVFKINYSLVFEIDTIVKKYNLEELTQYITNKKDISDLEKDLLNFHLLSFNPGRAFSWIGLEYLNKDNIEEAIKYFDKAKTYNDIYADYYLARHYYNIDEFELSMQIFERCLKYEGYSDKKLKDIYEYLLLTSYMIKKYMKQVYYIYKAISLGSSLGWYFLGISYDRNIDTCYYLSNSDAYAKYCYLKASENPEYEKESLNRIDLLSDVSPLKPNIDYILEFEDYILSDDYVDAMDIKIEAYYCYTKKPYDFNKAEELLKKLIDLKYGDAGYIYAIYFLLVNEKGIVLDKVDKPIIINDKVSTIKNDVENSLKFLRMSSDIGSKDAMFLLLSFYSNPTDPYFNMTLAEIEYNKIMKHFNNCFDEIENEVLEIYLENKKILDSFNENKYLENYKNNPHKSYLKQYFRLLDLIDLKKKFINLKITRKLPDNFIKMDINNISNNSEELLNNAIYYLTEEYNEKLAYYFAYKSYDLGNEYSKYLLGVIYDLGIFTPRANSYAKYFYLMVNALELNNLEHIEALEPKRIDILVNNDNPIFDLIEGLKLISVGDNLVNVGNMNLGLDLIKKAVNEKYPEACYILGGLYFDVEQDMSRLWDKGSLIHLEANKYKCHDYLKYASEYGHEESLLVLSSLHAYKYYSSNKITNKDTILSIDYLNELTKIHQYPYLIDLDFPNDNKFDVWKIRFYDLDDYIEENYSILFNNAELNTIALGNILITLNCKRLEDFNYFYNVNDYSKYKKIFEMVILYFIKNNMKMKAYYMYLEAYKLGIKELYIDKFIKIRELELYDTKYYLTI